MARPANAHPTPAELEVLQILWSVGPITVRQVMDRFDPIRNRADTTAISLKNVMSDKGLLQRKMQGRAFIYPASVDNSDSRPTEKTDSQENRVDCTEGFSGRFRGWRSGKPGAQ